MYTSCLNYGKPDKGHRANGFTTDGGFAEYAINHINTLARVPDTMSDAEATLVVTAGCGWAQREGAPIEEIHPGDVVWFPPNEKHWHGATPTTAMTHIAIQEKLNGSVVTWLEQVTEDQYRK